MGISSGIVTMVFIEIIALLFELLFYRILTSGNKNDVKMYRAHTDDFNKKDAYNKKNVIYNIIR